MKLGGLAFVSLVAFAVLAPRPAVAWQNCVKLLVDGVPDEPELEFDVRKFWMHRILLVDQIEKIFPNPDDARRVLLSVGALAVRNQRVSDAIDKLREFVVLKLSQPPGCTVVALAAGVFRDVRDSEYEPGKVPFFGRDGAMMMVNASSANPIRRLVPFLVGEDDGQDRPSFYAHMALYKQQFLPRTVQMSLRRMLVVLALSNHLAPHEEVRAYFEKYFMFNYRVLAIFDDLARRVLAEYEKGEEGLEALWSRLEVGSEETNEVRP